MAAEGVKKPLLDDDGEERHNHGAAGTQDSERELARLVRVCATPAGRAES